MYSAAHAGRRRLSNVTYRIESTRPISRRRVLDAAWEKFRDNYGRERKEEVNGEQLELLPGAHREWSWIVQAVQKGGGLKNQGAVAHRISTMVDRLVDNHEPLAYVLGSQPFGALDILCRPPVLIPRSETEFLTEHLSGMLLKDLQGVFRSRHIRVLDLCAGTGCIGLALRHQLEKAPRSNASFSASIVAADISSQAIALSASNADRLGNRTPNSCVRYHVHQMDMMKDEDISTLCFNEESGFDVVICNPPYISSSQWSSLDTSVKEWEDPGALVGQRNQDGLLYYHRLADLASRTNLLKSLGDVDQKRQSPNLAVEVGHDQAEDVQRLFQNSGCFSRVTCWKDQYQVDRGVFAWL